MEKGGEVLVPGDPSTPVQFIDVRDLADLSIHFAEKGMTGIYNATGPRAPTVLGELVEIAQATAETESKVTWVPPSWLAERRDRDLWEKMLFWSYEPEGWAWSMQMTNKRLLAKGINLRPIKATMTDTLEWYHTLPAERQALLFSRTEGNAGTTAISTEYWDTYLRRERDLLKAWHARGDTRNKCANGENTPCNSDSVERSPSV
jgi:2'-hydroxyisoflavone reductase